MENSSPLITIIVCTRRRPNSLSLALESLTKQTWQVGGWEVLVVENDTEPSPFVTAVIENFKIRLPVRWCLEQVAGLSRARNLGAQVAKGVYLAYIDDDVELAPGWLTALMNGCSRYQPDICGGPSYPLFRAPKPHWYPEEYEAAYILGSEPRILVQSETLGGMNFTIKRSLVLSLGGFREDLGMAGSKIAFAEETALMFHAWDNNPMLRVQYLPDAAVFHEVRPEKMTVRWQVRKWFARGRDCGLLETGKRSITQMFRFFAYHIYWFLRKFPGFVTVLLFDFFRPGRTMWQRYLIDLMNGRINQQPLRFYVSPVSKSAMMKN